MEWFKKMVRKIVFPKIWILIFCVFGSIILLTYIFAGGHKEDWSAVFAYVFSAYSLIIVCTRIGTSAGHTKETIHTRIDNIPLVYQYFTDVSFRLHVSLDCSLGLNVAYAAMKFVFGLYYHSVWFGTLAIYYFLLAVMRFLLLYHVIRKGFGADWVGEMRRYRICGIILMTMNIVLTGVVVLVIRKNESFQYAGYLIYIMAMYAFYNIITAVVNVIKYKKYNSPIMSAAKAINLAAALVSMLSLETAMLSQFGSENSQMFRRVMTACTGAGVCAIILVMAIYMIYHATIKLNEISKEKKE